MKYCQFNEEQHIIDFFTKYGFGRKILCDIGARLEGSNCARMIEEYGFTGLLVDANDKHVRELQHKFPKIESRNLRVTIENVNSLIPDHCDLLSIDIDSNDGWIFLNILKRPRLIIVETQDADGMFLSEYSDVRNKHACGISSDALRVLADLKGYRIAGKTGVNCFLVDKGCDFSFEDNMLRPAQPMPPNRNVLR